MNNTSLHREFQKSYASCQGKISNKQGNKNNSNTQSIIISYLCYFQILSKSEDGAAPLFELRTNRYACRLQIVFLSVNSDKTENRNSMQNSKQLGIDPGGLEHRMGARDESLIEELI